MPHILPNSKSSEKQGIEYHSVKNRIKTPKMPPKKMGVNSKAEAARGRRSATEAERKESEARQKEEQYWREAEGSKSRAAKKREEEAEKRAEAAARKAEARRLAEQEEKELEKMVKKPDKKLSRVAAPVPKVTEAELRKRREEEAAAMAKKSEESKKKQTRTAAEEEYERMVLVSNTNRDDSVIEARSVEEAIVQMSVAEPLPVDRHPEKRLKASFKAFEEAELPRLKEEKPGLTHNQYRDMIWKLWKKSPDNPLNQVCMRWGCHTIEPQMLSCRCKTVKNRRTIIAGLNSDTCSREMLLALLTSVVKAEENVIAIHVEETDDTFDPNSFHIHEDLCKSKKVDFLVKVCIGDSYISELTYQAQCFSYQCLPERFTSCTLLVMNSVGRILFQREGTCQQGSVKVAMPLQSSQSFSSVSTSYNQSNMTRQLHKSLTIPSIPSVSSMRRTTRRAFSSAHKTVEVSDFVAQKLFHRLALLEAEGSSRHFASQELRYATNNFSPDMVIGEGGHSKVYQATLKDGRAAAVKIFKTTDHSVCDLFREVDFLSSMNHKNIVQIIGFCDSGEMLAIVYELLHGSLRKNLRQLRWIERMKVAVGVAKALEYLHHSHNPPIIHRDVKSSNILLSHDCEPILSDFGAAMVLRHSQHADAPFDIVGTFGYLAPEYMMYGKVDEKIDVYSYGVVLLELITGKEAIQTDQEIRESLVLWARSLLSHGICERLIDPYLSEDYNKEEMEVMMIAARLCLMHASSRRPTMKTILRLFEEPDHWLSMQREREEFLRGTDSTDETAL